MTPKIKSFIVLSLTLTVLVMLLWWFAFLSTQKLPAQKKQLRDSTQNFKNILYQLSDVKDYNNMVKFTKAGWALINPLFVNQKDALNIIKVLEKNAQKNTVQLKIKKLSGGTQEDNAPLRLNLDLTGSFNNIYQFLGAMESYPYFININNININRAESSQSVKVAKNNPALVTATIIIDILTQK